MNINFVYLCRTGPLNPASNISYSYSNAVTIMITWKPPPSLNLTDVEPNIAYCIEVYNVSDKHSDYLHGNCSILEPRYAFTFKEAHPSGRIRIVVIPRSNVEGSSNGTSSKIEVMLDTLVQVSTSTDAGTETKASYKFQSSNIMIITVIGMLA